MKILGRIEYKSLFYDFFSETKNKKTSIFAVFLILISINYFFKNIALFWKLYIQYRKNPIRKFRVKKSFGRIQKFRAEKMI